MTVNKITIEEISKDDWPEVEALKNRNGLIGEDPDLQKLFFASNPNNIHKKSFPDGWVLRSNKDIVGVICSLPVLYKFRGEDIIAAAASSFVVDLEYRNHSLSLFSKFSNQEGFDLLVDTTALDPVDKLLKLFKFYPIPNMDYHNILFYIIDLSAFIESVFLKLKVPGLITKFLKIITFPISIVYKVLNDYSHKKDFSSIKEIKIDSVNEDFDMLWNEKINSEPNKLFTNRTSSSLKWHFSKSYNSDDVKIFSYYKNKRLYGYIIIRCEKTKKINLKRYKIIDIFVKDDNNKIINNLISYSFNYVKKNKGSVLEMLGFTGTVRENFKKNIFFTRKLSTMPYHFKIINNDLLDALNTESCWYPTPLDGDSSI